jgi:hypothetical protein
MEDMLCTQFFSSCCCLLSFFPPSATCNNIQPAEFRRVFSCPAQAAIFRPVTVCPAAIDKQRAGHSKARPQSHAQPQIYKKQPARMYSKAGLIMPFRHRALYSRFAAFHRVARVLIDHSIKSHHSQFSATTAHQAFV